MPIMRRPRHSHQSLSSQLTTSICVKRNINVNAVEPVADIGTQQAFKILRDLPKYRVGDPMRKVDTILCYSKEATAFAMKKLRPNDCAFVLRSDGSFTYALYQGYDDKDSSLMTFQVSDEGHIKALPEKSFCNRVKVPTIPVAFMDKIPTSLYMDAQPHPEEENKVAPEEDLDDISYDEHYIFRKSSTLIRQHGQHLTSQSAPQLARRRSRAGQTERPQKSGQRRVSTGGVLERFDLTRNEPGKRTNSPPVSFVKCKLQDVWIPPP